jgi:hypothetical protein
MPNECNAVAPKASPAGPASGIGQRRVKGLGSSLQLGRRHVTSEPHLFYGKYCFALRGRIRVVAFAHSFRKRLVAPASDLFSASLGI